MNKYTLILLLSIALGCKKNNTTSSPPPKVSGIPNIQWQKCLGGLYSESAASIAQTKDLGYIISGWTASSDGDITGGIKGYEDAWVIKLTNSGTLQWQKTYGGTGNDYADHIQQTTDG